MRGIIRAGDEAEIDGFEGEEGKRGVDPKDDISKPPPPDGYDEEEYEEQRISPFGDPVFDLSGKPIMDTKIKKIPKYNSPPKKKVMELIKARAVSEHGVFANGRSVLTADGKYTDAQVNYYDREWEIDEKGHLAKGEPYTDNQTGSTEQKDIHPEEGCANVFVNGQPVVGKGHKLSLGKTKEYSKDSFIPS